MRILFLGDTHGNVPHIEWLFEVAAALGVDVIFQVGDFGYWEHSSSGIGFLNLVSKLSQETGIRLVFLDGNHENHPLLWYRYVGIPTVYTSVLNIDEALNDYIGKHDVAFSDEGFAIVRPGVEYAPRGHRWVWDDLTFLAVGGAYSIDRAWRKLGHSYWFEEIIQEEDIDKAIDGGEVDVLLTHDVLEGSSVFPALEATHGRKFRPIPEALRERDKLLRIAEATLPKLNVHGHYHVRYDDIVPLNDTRSVVVRGLDCDESGENSYIVVDTKDLLNVE